MKGAFEVDERRDVQLDSGRNVIRLGADQNRVAKMEKDATHLVDRLGLANDEDRHVDRALLLHVHGEEVDVERLARNRVLLDCVEQHGERLAAVELKVNDRVAAGVATKYIELARVDGNGL